MNGALENLIALIMALSTATGGAANIDKSPDRPVIVAPAPAPAGTVNQQQVEGVEINGVITAINGKSITVGGQIITLDANTKVDGKLAVGANVQVEGVSQGSGVVATQVEVKDTSLTSSTDKQDDSKTKSVSSDDKGKDVKDDKGKDVNDDKGKTSSDDKSGDKSGSEDKSKDGSSDSKSND